MSIVLLISETTLKKYTVVNDNVDACYITPSIQKAQDMGLQPIIGTALLRKVCSLIPNDILLPENSVYKKLLSEYITPYLCNKATAELQWALFAKIRNNGIVTSQDNQTQQISIADCEYLRKKYEYDADFYAQRMTDFLYANSKDYPEWKQRETVADMRADNDAYKTNIVL